MNTKHTPGPWQLSQTDEGHVIEMATAIHENPYEPQHVIEYRHGVYDGDQLEEAEANARLIAAAPELLEALRECAEMVDGYSYDSNIETGMASALARIADKARAAIAKATGETI